MLNWAFATKIGNWQDSSITDQAYFLCGLTTEAEHAVKGGNALRMVLKVLIDVIHHHMLSVHEINLKKK